MATACLHNCVSSLDLFGYPLTLKYKNQSHFKSPLGGVASAFTTIAVVAYFASLLLQMLGNQGSITLLNEIKADTKALTLT